LVSTGVWALSRTEHFGFVEGQASRQPILKNPEFIAGRIDTGFLVRNGFLGEKR
jgi:hypothetical protein